MVKTKFNDFNAGRAHQLTQQGMSVRRVAATMGMCWRTARKLVHNEGALREKKLCRRVATRRPFVGALVGELVTYKGHTWPKYTSSTAIAAAVHERTGVKCSKSTVRRDLRALGFVPRVRRKVPTKDPKVYKKRLEFALRWVDSNPDVILFSDEHTCTVNDSSSRTQWVMPGGQVTTRMRKRVHNIARVSVWGTIGVGYKKLVLLPGKVGKVKLRLNSRTYIDHCLCTIFGETNGRIFMQDGATPHVAKATLGRLRAEGVKVMEGWPPYSPDLNPIENLWSTVNRRVSESHPTSEEELNGAVQKAWDSFGVNIVNRFCRSFPSRLARCIQRQGVP
jgi:transposase